MAASVVTTFEHTTLTVGEERNAALTPHEGNRLLVLNAQRPGFCVPVHRGVRLAGYAGLVNLGDRVLEVLPKIGDDTDAGQSRGTLLRLLRLSRGAVRVFSSGSIGHDLCRGSLLSVFVARFLDEVSLLARGGLVRRYRARREDLRVVRGRLDVHRQAGVLGFRRDRLASRYDDLSIDNPWNQVLAAALVAVRPWIGNLDDARRWMELTAMLVDVTQRPDAVMVIDTLMPDRQVRHYAASMEWAGLILRLLTPNVRAGRAHAPELLFDMNRLFEAAVASVVQRRASSLGAQVATQEQERHLAIVASPNSTQMFCLRPDLVVRDGSGVFAVGDTKWKRLDVSRHGWSVPSESDVYQMHAYAAAYPCEDFCLIYPYHPALATATPATFDFPASGGRKPRLHVAFVDAGEEHLPLRLVSEDTWFARVLPSNPR